MKLSIITINYNNAEGLRETMESVFAQTFTDFEYIIVDGGSTDGSVDVIAPFLFPYECERCIKGKSIMVCAISEPDKGIYNAMNKGICMATGKYLLFLNSGDYLAAPDVLEKIFAHALVEDIVYGDMYNVKDGIEKAVYYPDEQSIDFMWFVDSTIPHGASFIRRDAFDKVGLYNENNKIVSDWEWFMLAICKYNCSLKHIPISVYKYDCTGVSSVAEHQQLIANERQRALQTYFSAFLPLVQRLKSAETELIPIKRNFIYRVLRKVCKCCRKIT